jgi:hypothetical protein
MIHRRSIHYSTNSRSEKKFFFAISDFCKDGFLLPTDTFEGLTFAGRQVRIGLLDICFEVNGKKYLDFIGNNCITKLGVYFLHRAPPKICLVDPK